MNGKYDIVILIVAYTYMNISDDINFNRKTKLIFFDENFL